MFITYLTLIQKSFDWHDITNSLYGIVLYKKIYRVKSILLKCNKLQF